MLSKQGRLTHCNIAAEGAGNRIKNQNFGGPQGGQQWGMMGQQQYPAQGTISGFDAEWYGLRSWSPALKGHIPERLALVT